MARSVSFESEFLMDGHLLIPSEIIRMLKLREGDKVKTSIETKVEKAIFDKDKFLKLFGAWKDKKEEEINLYKEIFRNRNEFGRGELRP